jgi:hypothetical protein
LLASIIRTETHHSFILGLIGEEVEGDPRNDLDGAVVGDRARVVRVGVVLAPLFRLFNGPKFTNPKGLFLLAFPLNFLLPEHLSDEFPLVGVQITDDDLGSRVVESVARRSLSLEGFTSLMVRPLR